MARLTDSELELIRQARIGSWQQTLDTDEIIAAAQAARSAYISRLLSRGLKSVAHYTGLADLGQLLQVAVIHPLRLRLRFRRTVNELRNLDRRMLRDIGLPDSDIEGYAWAMVSASLPAPEFKPALTAKIVAWLRNRALVLELQAMDDRQLSDIGLSRGDIQAAVTGMLSRPRPAKRTATTALGIAAISVSHPQFRHAA